MGKIRSHLAACDLVESAVENRKEEVKQAKEST